MATATIEGKQLTEFATQVYEAQKDDFVQDLAERIKKSIEIGMNQAENGQVMSFDEFKDKFIKEHNLDGKI